MATPTDETETENENSKKRMKSYLFRFGNYHQYYGYRVGKKQDEDPRLKFFQREWFEGKDCLDVGCNEGRITIAIAQKFDCKSMLGVDLDGDLIARAKSNLEAAIAATESHDDVPRQSDRAKAEVQRIVQSRSDGEESSSVPNVGNGGSDTVLYGRRALQRVTFKEEQFIENFTRGDFLKDGTYDTILCLSVTKWVHLNWGDQGLIKLFAKMHRILRMGGVMIIEPQPWKSYESKKRVSQTTRRHFSEILLRPAHFKTILLDKIGFKSVTEISKAVPKSVKGFDRALYVYTK